MGTRRIRRGRATEEAVLLGPSSPPVGPVRIRHAGQRDVRGLALSFVAAEREGFLEPESGVDVTVRLAERHIATGIARAPVNWIVAADAHGPLGAIVCIEGPSPSVLSFGMWLVAGARRQGIGSMLLTEHLAARPGAWFQIEAWADNVASIAFFESHAFHPVSLTDESRRRYDGSLCRAQLLGRRGSLRKHFRVEDPVFPADESGRNGCLPLTPLDDGRPPPVTGSNGERPSPG